MPLALVFGLATLGFGFALFPLIVAGVGFLYRTRDDRRPARRPWACASPASSSAAATAPASTWLTALLHTAIYTRLLSASSCCSSSAAPTILGTRYRQSLPDLILGTTAINRPAE